MKKTICILVSAILLSLSIAALAENENETFELSDYSIVPSYTQIENDYSCDEFCDDELCDDCGGCDDCDHDYIAEEYAIGDVGEEYAFVEDDYSPAADLSEFSEYVLAANSHRHTISTTYSYSDNIKHTYQKKCSSCGKVTASGKQNHQPKNSKGDSFTQLNDKKHKVTYTCKLCGKQYTKELSHSFKTKVEKNGNDTTYHNVIKYCQYCGYRASATKAKHTLSGGVCTKCGYQNTSKVYKATGYCASYGKSPLYDSKLYKNCPKCGSYSATVIGTKRIHKNLVQVGGARVDIYHQQVKCSSCRTSYWNKCYAQRVK